MQLDCLLDTDWIDGLGLSFLQRNQVTRLLVETPSCFHLWLPRAGRLMRRCGMTKGQVFDVLRCRSRKHSRFVAREEIESAIRLVFDAPFRAQELSDLQSAFASMEWRAKLASLEAASDWPHGFGLQELLDTAPALSSKLCDLATRQIVQGLFEKAPARESGERWICVGWNGGRSSMAIRLEEYLQGGGPESANLVVPNLSKQQFGITRDGLKSERALESFPRRDYLVLESDIGHGTWDLQARLIRFAGTVLQRRPVMVVVSGSKSLHSWWPMFGLPEHPVRRFISEMKGLFDPTAATLSQFARMPNSFRGTKETNAGAKQQVIFFDHEALEEGRPMAFR